MRRAPALRRAAWLSAASIATVVLFAVSRGKWSDAVVDSGREWIVPDALARGQLLYRDVVYWFGPFTPYFQSVFLRAFGSGFEALVAAGVVGAAAVLVCLHYALRRVADANAAWAWTILAIPLLVFMPDGGGAILGMGFRMWHAAGFALVALTLAAHSPVTKARILAAGGLAGLAGLCRTEWGLAALAALVVVVIRLGVSVRQRLPAIAVLLGGFLIVMTAGLGFFVWRAGASAVLTDAPVLLYNLPSVTLGRAPGLLSGWFRGSLQMAYGAFAGFAAFSAIELLAVGHRDRARARAILLRLAVLLAAVVLCAALGGLPAGGLLAAGPLVCGLSIVAGLRTSDPQVGAALSGFGTMGLAAFHRRLFFVTDGPYVAPALLFALVCAAGCASWLSGRRDASIRPALARVSTAAVAALAAAAFLIRLSEYHSDSRVPIPGTQGILSASPRQAGLIDALARQIQRLTPAGAGLVVFPEGEILNCLASRPNPIRYKLYLPGYVDSRNEGEIVRELSGAPPAAIVIWPRPLGEYGAGFFGRDYGVGIQRWIDARYERVPLDGHAGAGSRVVLAIRKATRP